MVRHEWTQIQDIIDFILSFAQKDVRGGWSSGSGLSCANIILRVRSIPQKGCSVGEVCRQYTSQYLHSALYILVRIKVSRAQAG